MFRTLITLILPVALLGAQGSPPVPQEQKNGRHDAIVAHLHRVRVERLQQSLGISAEKAKSIADRWARFDVDNREHRHRMRQLHQQVNGLLLSALSEEEKNTQIRPLVNQFATLRLQQQELKRKFEEEINSSLTPAQQGRFILAVEEIQRALLEAMREQRKASGQ